MFIVDIFDEMFFEILALASHIMIVDLMELYELKFGTEK